MNKLHLELISLARAWGLPGCGQAAGTRPHDMSAADHDSTAADSEQTAASHDQAELRDAQQGKEDCNEWSDGDGTFVCWTRSEHATVDHNQLAEKHRKLAAQHRAASQALRDAEATACVGVAADDRDMSPFSNVEDVVRVEKLDDKSGVRETAGGEPALPGASIVIAAVPGLTLERLQKIVDCHLARNAALGHEAPDMPYCPLVPHGAKALVRPAKEGFVVDVFADESAVGVDIWRRAQLIQHQR